MMETMTLAQFEDYARRVNEDIAYLRQKNEALASELAWTKHRMDLQRVALEAVCFFWERDPEAFGDEASVTTMAGKFAEVAHLCQIALRGG